MMHTHSSGSGGQKKGEAKGLQLIGGGDSCMLQHGPMKMGHKPHMRGN